MTVRDPMPTAVDTPTIDALVPIVPELAVMLVVVGLVVWLAWRILVTLDRELDRRAGRPWPHDVADTIRTVLDTREPPDPPAEPDDPVS